MYLTLEHRFAFVHIPKTAGETLFRLFADALGSTTRDPPLAIAYWGQDKRRGLDLTHLHQDVLYEYVPQRLYEDCVSFCVVRDPYDRFYSAFGDIPSKVHYSQHVAKNQAPFWVTKYDAYPDPKTPKNSAADVAKAFAQFCQVVDTQGIPDDVVSKHNIHLVPQHKFVYRGNKQNVTAVLRYESLDEGLPKLFAAHKLPFERNPRFRNKPGWKERRHWRIHFNDLDPTRLKKRYLSKYTPAAIALVNKWYAKDFARFGYEMIDPATFTAPVEGAGNGVGRSVRGRSARERQGVRTRKRGRR